MGRRWQQEGDAKQDRIGRDREQGVASQQRHRENRVCADAEGGDQDQQVSDEAGMPRHQTIQYDQGDAHDGEPDAEHTLPRRSLETERRAEQ